MPDGSLYKKATLVNYRHSIQRFLSTKRSDINIVHGDAFKDSKTLFKAQVCEMKKNGRAKVDHHPPIEEDDMRKLYNYVCSSVSATHLQQKVCINL